MHLANASGVLHAHSLYSARTALLLLRSTWRPGHSFGFTSTPGPLTSCNYASSRLTMRHVVKSSQMRMEYNKAENKMLEMT